MTAKIEINTGAAAAKLAEAQKLLANGRSMFQQIAQVLEAETERNFQAQGRPSWVPLKASTIAARKKRNNGGSVMRILQDSGTLAASISTDYGGDFAQVGAGGAASAYAAVHQFGATVERAPYSTKVRLQTDAKGNLLRQGKDGKLAVFAKDSHKRARESWHEVGAFTVKIPARPYLPFLGSAQSAVLQPEAERSILDVVTTAIAASLS